MSESIDPELVWRDLTARIGLSNDQSTALWSELEKCYSEPQRHYHTLRHLAEMLGFMELFNNQSATSPELLVAAFYHDVVYDPTRSDNERRSADLCRDRLRDASPAADLDLRLVESLIMATAKHQLPESDHRFAVFLDADLSILGRSAERYDEYARQIRSEYGFVSEADYQSGRAAVLQSFLSRDRIYQTPVAEEMFEARARENLRREIGQRS